jgi:hypothetical protein
MVGNDLNDVADQLIGRHGRSADQPNSHLAEHRQAPAGN